MQKKIIKGKDLVDMIDKTVDYDNEDLEILNGMEKTEFQSLKKNNLKEFEKQKLGLMNIAKKPKKQVVTIRLDGNDINRIKKMAEVEGIPYQTMLSAMIHKIANGKVELNFKA